MNESRCPAGNPPLRSSLLDAIPNITDTELDPAKVKERAYAIWKRYGNQDEVGLSRGM